jgi:hypothetical protein
MKEDDQGANGFAFSNEEIAPHRLWVSLFTFCFFFCLDAKETKDQGKPDRSARFSVPARGISHLID